MEQAYSMFSSEDCGEAPLAYLFQSLEVSEDYSRLGRGSMASDGVRCSLHDGSSSDWRRLGVSPGAVSR